MLDRLAIPFVAYGHAFASMMADGNVFVPLVVLVALPALVFMGACALIDEMRP